MEQVVGPNYVLRSYDDYDELLFKGKLSFEDVERFSTFVATHSRIFWQFAFNRIGILQLGLLEPNHSAIYKQVDGRERRNERKKER